MADPLDIWRDIQSIFTGVADTAHAIDAVGAALGAAGELISDKYMWRSLGWILIGVFTMFLGIIYWIRQPLEAAIGTVGGAALKAP